MDAAFGMSFQQTSAPKLWAIGGGKGGVGKSFVSTSLALCAAKTGIRVTLVDLDLGSANLHTYLGMAASQLSLSDFIKSRVNDLKKIQVPTSQANLNFISGFNDSLDVTEMGTDNQTRLLKALRQLDCDLVILDLGAGTNAQTLDFFLAAERKITVISPEPTSIENAYRFIKAAFYRQLKKSEQDLNLQWLIQEAMDHKNRHGIRSPADLFQHIHSTDPAAGQRLLTAMQSFHLDILVNQVRDKADLDLGQSIQSVCHKYFGLKANFAGAISHDNSVWKSIRQRRIFFNDYPYSPIVTQFLHITQSLIVDKNSISQRAA